MTYDGLMADFAGGFVQASTLCDVRCRCGRLHFVSCCGHGDYEEGELERFLACSYAYPDQYIEQWEYDHVEWALIEGWEVVTDCPCGWAERYAKWLDNHIENVTKFAALRLKRRADSQERSAERDRQLLAGMAGT